MKVCQVTHTFLPKIGGREIHVFNLSRALTNLGIEVRVFTGDKVKKPSFERFANFSVVRLPSISVPLTLGSSDVDVIYRIIPSLPLMLMNSHIDLIHAHDYFHLSSDMSAWSSKLSGKPLVLTAHSMPSFFAVSKSLTFLEKIYNRSLGRFTLNEADKIIFMSHFQVQKYLDLGVEKSKVEVIHPCLDVKEFDEFLNINSGGKDFYSEKFGFRDNQIILFVGRIEKRKGVQYLIRAIPDIVKEIPKVRVVIVGPDAGYVNALRQMANDFNVARYVVFPGVLSDLELKRAICGADVFLLPSESENFPEVILKAAFLKRPIVASDVGGIPEFIEDGKNGFLVEAGDVEGISKNILMLLGDRDLALEFGENAHKKVVKKHTMKQMAIQTIKIYREILE